MDDRLVVSRAGLFARRTDLVPLARVQSLRLTQGPLQRWLRLASVHADSPVGLVNAQGPHREPAEARRLVQEGVERAREARMPPAACPVSDRVDARHRTTRAVTRPPRVPRLRLGVTLVVRTSGTRLGTGTEGM